MYLTFFSAAWRSKVGRPCSGSKISLKSASSFSLPSERLMTIKSLCVAWRVRGMVRAGTVSELAS